MGHFGMVGLEYSHRNGSCQCLKSKPLQDIGKLLTGTSPAQQRAWEVNFFDCI